MAPVNDRRAFFHYIFPSLAFLFSIRISVGAAVRPGHPLSDICVPLAPLSWPKCTYYYNKTMIFGGGGRSPNRGSKDASRSSLEFFWGPLWDPLGLKWRPVGPPWAPLGDQKSSRGPAWCSSPPPAGRCCFQGPLGPLFWLPKGPSGHNF